MNAMWLAIWIALIGAGETVPGAAGLVSAPAGTAGLQGTAGLPGPTVLVVVGAEGASQYAEPFRQWAGRWKAAAERGGARFLAVGLDPPGDVTDLERLEKLLADEPKQSPEALWLVLIGHGTFDGNAAKFNLRGPDVSAATLAEWLKPFERAVAVVDCSSSSAPFINRLSAPGRTVITATKSGYELNYSRFGDYISTAIGQAAADLDKDGQTSLLEAFLWASGRVAEFYDQEGRLATETALVDDNGDGQGTPASWFRGVRVVRHAKGGAVPDGVAAHQLHLIRSAAEAEMPPDVRARRDALEQAIEKLRASKTDQTDLEAYYAQLEPLVLELARLYEQADPQASAQQQTSPLPQAGEGPGVRAANSEPGAQTP